VSFADVLLRVIPEAEGELERLSVAVDLALRLHAKLDGVFVTDSGATDSNWARTLFERAASKTPLETSWRVVDGHSDAALLFQSRRADLTILPSGANDGGRQPAPETVALNSGRPVLILPAPPAAMSIGHTVLIGWDDTRESVRAIHDAMPLLLNADKVFVLTVMTEEDLEPLADRRFAEHMRRHGVSTELDRRYGDAAEEIASEARRLDVDMLVIGLRGQVDGGRLGLGEVSRRFVRSASLPVFCSA
jgi:nucleotide-binding universal stress UspA family protein